MNEMKKIVFLGSKLIGLEVFKILISQQKKINYEIVGLLTNDRGIDLKKYATKNNILVLNSLDEYLTLKKVDIAISVQYHEILKKEHINKVNQIALNLHMAPLPEYRGCNQFSFAILNQEKEFGTTIHKMDTGIDSGDILFQKRFSIPQNCWVEDLYNITFKKSIELFKENIENIVTNNIKSTSQVSLNKKSFLYYRKDIEKIKKIDLAWDKEKIERYIRATSKDGFEPSYVKIGSEKIYFKKDKNIK